ncbi:hypothetical protein K439DRAFT_1620107 [Ramaria rubella]|nr:hypothetical protein K439DRAFT_1620107 [Ramaria rubella]
MRPALRGKAKQFFKVYTQTLIWTRYVGSFFGYYSGFILFGQGYNSLGINFSRPTETRRVLFIKSSFGPPLLSAAPFSVSTVLNPSSDSWRNQLIVVQVCGSILGLREVEERVNNLEGVL